MDQQDLKKALIETLLALDGLQEASLQLCFYDIESEIENAALSLTAAINIILKREIAEKA